METILKEAREILKEKRLNQSFNYIVIMFDQYDWYERGGFLTKPDAENYKAYLHSVYQNKQIEIVEIN